MVNIKRIKKKKQKKKLPVNPAPKSVPVTGFLLTLEQVMRELTHAALHAINCSDLAHTATSEAE